MDFRKAPITLENTDMFNSTKIQIWALRDGLVSNALDAQVKGSRLSNTAIQQTAEYPIGVKD